jgi:hypothetical protein
MATSSASLVVKISADITDFTKQLNTATRVVDRATNQIANFGKALTIGVTAPVIAAAAALAKMATENEDTAARLERVFGAASSSVNASIQQMMKSVPEANTDLQKMAITAQNMALGLGLAPAKAAQVSESLLNLAGDASAFAHVPMEQALDALQRGLAGKTKGLLEFGIAINEADIKQRAMQMGLLHSGNELTETGTALAAYSLIMERSTRIQGEAGRTADQMGKQFQFLKRDLGELADNVSGIVLPALSDLAKAARDVVKVFAGLDQSTVSTFFKIAAGAAVIGPTLLAFAKLIDLGFKLKTAFGLLAAGESAGFFAALAALPFSTIVLGIAAITAALAAMYYEWNRLKEAGPGTRSAIAGIVGNVAGALVSQPFGQAVGGLIGSSAPKASPLVITHQAKPLSGGDISSLLSGSNGATERSTKDPLQQMEDTAKRLTDAFKHMGDGWQIPNLTEQWVRLLGQAQSQYDGIKDKTSEIATRLRDMIASLSEAAGSSVLRQSQVADLGKLSTSNLGVQSTKRFGTQALAIDPAKIADVGQAFSTSAYAAAAALDAQDRAAFETEYQYQQLRLTLEQFGISLGEVSARAQVAIGIAAGAALQFAQSLVASAGGSGKGAGIGRGLGGLAGGIAGALLGPAGSAAGALIGSSIGSVIGTGIGGLIGGAFDHTKKSTDGAASSLDSLAKTVDRVTESITNIPPFFKVQSYRFAAAPVTYLPPPTTGTPSTPYTPPPTQPTNPTPTADPNNQNPTSGTPNGSIIIQNAHFPNVTDKTTAQDFMAQMRATALKARNRGGSARFAMVGGSSF